MSLKNSDNDWKDGKTMPDYSRSDPKLLRTAADVTPEVLSDAEEIYEGWYANDERIDWDDFIDRLAKRGDFGSPPYDFDEYDNAAVRKIQRHIREIRSRG